MTIWCKEGGCLLAWKVLANLFKDYPCIFFTPKWVERGLWENPMQQGFESLWMSVLSVSCGVSLKSFGFGHFMPYYNSDDNLE